MKWQYLSGAFLFLVVALAEESCDREEMETTICRLCEQRNRSRLNQLGNMVDICFIYIVPKEGRHVDYGFFLVCLSVKNSCDVYGLLLSFVEEQTVGAGGPV
jgi:hypothetical protein